MSFNHLLIEDAGTARIITLNRPARRNALSREVITELRDAVLQANRTVIVAAAGPVFSAGHDLRELRGASPADLELIFEECSTLMLELRELPHAVIAEVDGLATAAGCQLVAACDLAVATPESLFATPGVTIGVFCTTPAVPLVRCIGLRRAMEMLLTGSPIRAETALAWGLLNRVVARDELRSHTLALAQSIAQGSPSAIAAGKRAVYAGSDMAEPAAYQAGSRVMVQNLTEPDGREGVSAFLEKRSARWH
jgi:enoyl-CoA hydratase/carnithine racemase